MRKSSTASGDFAQARHAERVSQSGAYPIGLDPFMISVHERSLAVELIHTGQNGALGVSDFELRICPAGGDSQEWKR
jgi:hypothetical protein